MKTIVAAFHPDLPRDLQQGLLNRKDIHLIEVRTLPDLIDRLSRDRGADLCMLGPLLGNDNAASVSQTIRQNRRIAATPLVLLITGGAQVPAAHMSHFDEVLEWPLKATVLPLVLARFLGLPLRESERFQVRVHVFMGSAGGAAGGAAASGPEQYLGSTLNLSEVGLLLRTSRHFTLGERLLIRFAPPGRAQEMMLPARAVRIDSQTCAPDNAVGLHFEGIGDAERQALQESLATLGGSRNFRWHIMSEPGREVVMLSGVLNAQVDLAPLKQLRGEVHFFMRDFRRISSDSIQTWLDMVRSLTGASKIRLHACPIAFVQQANAISNLLEHTEVVSFFAPYVCSRCGLDEEQLIDVKRDLHDEHGELLRQPPLARCVRCGADMTFDDIPERYFMFL